MVMAFTSRDGDTGKVYHLMPQRNGVQRKMVSLIGRPILDLNYQYKSRNTRGYWNLKESKENP